MDMATLEYLKDTEQIKRVDLHTEEETPSLDTTNSLGFDEGYAGPTESVRDLLLTWDGSITRQEYEAYKLGVKNGQAKYWTEKQAQQAQKASDIAQ